MAFATLEEAWGNNLGSGPGGPAGPPLGRIRDPWAAAEPRRQPEAPGFGGPGAGFGGPGGFAPGAPGFGVGPAGPGGFEDDAASIAWQEAQRFVARVYTREGLEGVLRLMPREAARELDQAAGGWSSSSRRGGGWTSDGGRRPRRDRGGAGWAWLADFLACPEKVLLALLCLFAVLVAWDGWQAERTAHAAAALASLHMTPFPTASVLG
jgi:hypothetical protein